MGIQSEMKEPPPPRLYGVQLSSSMFSSVQFIQFSCHG